MDGVFEFSQKGSQIIEITLESCKKSSLKHFTETPIFAQLREFFSNVLSKIVCLENFSAFTGKKSASKSPFKEGCNLPA